MRIEEALRMGRQRLAIISDSPAIDADRLLLKTLGRDETSWLIAHGDEELGLEDTLRYKHLLARREAGEPLAYVLGQWDFYGRTFEVSADVLVPRPATENLIHESLLLSDAMSATLERKVVLADIGTGSGCIAITLLLESPHIDHIYATDLSEEALAVARINAERHNVLDRITFLNGDMLDPIIEKHIDLVVSNPPYVPTEELSRERTIETRGLDFEPRMALDGGANGLKFVDQIKEHHFPAIVETLGGEIEVLGFNSEN